MEKTLLAYLAGIIDADGTIGVKRSTYAMRVIKNSGQATFSERVCVKQVEPHAVALLHETFGGYRFVAKPSAKKGKPLHGWQVTDLKAAAALRAILPYLRIKKAQAENCLALRVVKERSKKERVAFGRKCEGAVARPIETTNEMEALCERAHALNSVGV